MGKPGKLLCTVRAFRLAGCQLMGLAFADRSRTPGKRTGATYTGENNVVGASAG